MSEASEKLSGATLRRLLQLVKVHTGITMEERKRELLFGRIRPRMRALGHETPEQYVDYLESNSEETQEFVNRVTTNETLFFRTPIIWEFFTTSYLPEWYAKNPDQVLKIWSAASSSGEEACSIAMSCEEFRLKNPSFRYKIQASDISTDVLNIARHGNFKDKSVEDLRKKQPMIFEKYFRENSSGQARFAEHVLGTIEFFVHNLHNRSPKTEFFDLVFLRNVLIYFNEADQELVLRNIHGALKNGGTLIVGESESLARLKTSFEFSRPLIYKRTA
ncbi:MAG: protein-glutamate O-methyltransferase CheR [Bdellovibrio sp.]|nr:protein-glutamate O-methyltransferase CheR [Bdellovibrio sp.]